MVSGLAASPWIAVAGWSAERPSGCSASAASSSACRNESRSGRRPIRAIGRLAPERQGQHRRRGPGALRLQRGGQPRADRSRGRLQPRGLGGGTRPLVVSRAPGWPRRRSMREVRGKEPFVAASRTGPPGAPRRAEPRRRRAERRRVERVGLPVTSTAPISSPVSGSWTGQAAQVQLWVGADEVLVGVDRDRVAQPAAAGRRAVPRAHPAHLAVVVHHLRPGAARVDPGRERWPSHNSETTSRAAEQPAPSGRTTRRQPRAAVAPSLIADP